MSENTKGTEPLRECPCCGAHRSVITPRVDGTTSCVRCPACGFQTIGAGPGTDWCVKSWNAPRHYDAELARLAADLASERTAHADTDTRRRKAEEELCALRNQLGDAIREAREEGAESERIAIAASNRALTSELLAAQASKEEVLTALCESEKERLAALSSNRALVEENERQQKALHNILLTTTRALAYHPKAHPDRFQDILRFCSEAGVEGSILRNTESAAALSPSPAPSVETVEKEGQR